MTQADIELLEQYIDGTLADDDAGRLRVLLRDSAEARAMLRSLATIDFALQDIAATKDADSRGSLREPIEEENTDTVLSERIPILRRSRTTRFMGALLAVATLIIVALSTILFFQRPSTQRPVDGIATQQAIAGQPIAKITGLSGPLQWTGDGGQVFHNLSVGSELAGGTVEGLAPGSWFELKFKDGSTVTISGSSTLTFSDQGQKELHLKEGYLSSNVKPQPTGKPMLIYTRSAMLEVLGTRFEVEAELVATTLNVSEGSVRVKRFSDGAMVDVPAKHRVVAAADRDMLPIPVPDSVDRWKSQLDLGPTRGRGKWSPGSDGEDAKLRAIPYTPREGITIYTATFAVSPGDEPPVILPPDSRLRVHGRIASTHKVYFGVTVRHAGGEFAGRFQTTRPAAEIAGGQDFGVVLDLRDFQLDPALDGMKNTLPRAPFGLVVESIWCHTGNKQAGLELTEVELAPAMEDASK